MASNVAVEVDESTLPDIFKSLWATYLMIEKTEESTGSDRIQGELRKALIKAEEAIKMVNMLQLFSNNEDIEEVATNEVRYMMVPALLGYFHALNTHASRLPTVLKAKNYYKDFLRMCKSYKVASIHIPLDAEDDQEVVETSTQVEPVGHPLLGKDLRAMACQRSSKIDRFKQNKEYESRLKELSEAVEKESVDDEVKREFYLIQLKRWVNKALDEVDSLNSEEHLLQRMAEIKKQTHSHGHSHSSGDTAAGKAPTSKGLRPFIVTKDVIQKQVYGMGYPGIPTMTIEEFCQEKVDDGTFSIPLTQPASQSLQGRAENPEKARQEMEREEAEREKKEEEDDPKLLQAVREMDEFKDDHRRGWGNRQNMG